MSLKMNDSSVRVVCRVIVLSDKPHTIVTKVVVVHVVELRSTTYQPLSLYWDTAQCLGLANLMIARMIAAIARKLRGP